LVGPSVRVMRLYIWDFDGVMVSFAFERHCVILGWIHGRQCVHSLMILLVMIKI
jgi:hypothetical protein